MTDDPQFPRAQPRKKLIISFDDDPAVEAAAPTPAPTPAVPAPPATGSAGGHWSSSAPLADASAPDSPTVPLRSGPVTPVPRPPATGPTLWASHSSQAPVDPPPPAYARERSAPQPPPYHPGHAAPQPPPPAWPQASGAPTQPLAPPQWPSPSPATWSPQPVATQRNYASWGLRVVATLVDGALAVIITIVVMLVVGAGAGVFGLSAGADEGTASVTGVFAAILAYLAVSVIWGLVYAPLTMMRGGAHNGQTLGKQLVGIRVVRQDGAPMTAGTAIMRDVVIKNFVIWGLGSLLFAIPGILDSLWPLWDGQHQSWHDKAVSTVVTNA